MQVNEQNEILSDVEDAPDPVMDGFRLELLNILQGGKKLDARTCMLIIQIASAARDILAVRNPRSRHRRIRRGYGMMNPAFVDPMDEECAEDIPEPFGPAQEIDRETFGAKVLRELVAIVPEIARVGREDPAQIVKAIAAAKEAGLVDVASRLEERLLGSTAVAKDASVPSPPPFTDGRVMRWEAEPEPINGESR